MSGLQDKVVIVTGGARGIGAAVAARMARDGATVVVTDLLDEQGAKTASEIRGLFLRHDVTSEDDWKSMVEATVERYGRVDGLVNNAGIAAGAPLESDATELGRHRIRVNAVNPGVIYTPMTMERNAQLGR